MIVPPFRFDHVIPSQLPRRSLRVSEPSCNRLATLVQCGPEVQAVVRQIADCEISNLSFHQAFILIDTLELVGQRQAIGILGMVFAVLGGVAWFLRQNIVAIMLWGVTGLILLKLNKRFKPRRR